MPKNILYKYRCKELLCNQIVRSDKWNAHCKKKHGGRLKEGVECKKETIMVREKDGEEWKKFTTGDDKKKT